MQAIAVSSIAPRSSEAIRGLLVTAIVLACSFAVSAIARAQSLQSTAPNPSPAAQTSTRDPESQQKPVRVTTTVVVHGELQDNYLPESIMVGTLTGEPLKDAPLSAAVVTRDMLNDQVSRLLSDVVQNDASLGNDYVPVGYYGDYQIRGFPVDLATGLEINGMTIAGEQDVPLENKQSVEILNGLAAVESGVASAGGLIDYVTKRPSNIKALDLATDQRGTAYGAVDLGHLFGSQKQVGARINLAAERIVTYMNDTNGWRAVGAGAADWKLNPATILKGDFEYQHKTERDGSGYQLLGGAIVPNINRIYRSTMLGDQPWGPPDTYDTFNTNARLDYTFSPSWLAFAAASLSHSLIQDNVIYAYGCYYEPECTSSSTPYPWFFAPDGTYDIYDYRDPGELHMDAEAEAMTRGHIKIGPITNDVAAGVELYLRSVRQPGFYTAANPDPVASGGTEADGAVYTYVGSENIYLPIVSLPAPGDSNSLESPFQSAGPRRLWEDSHQVSAILQDRVQLLGRVQFIAGTRYDALHDHNYSAYASCAFAADFNPAAAPSPNPCAPQLRNTPVWLPQYAVTYGPTKNLTFYSNYGVMLSLGPQAPFWAANGSQFLPPFFTRQAEIGVKYELGGRILLTGDLFHMRAPFFYPDDPGLGADCFGIPTSTSAPLCFLSKGRETHNGFEFNAEGKAANWLRLDASGAAISAISTETGTPSFNNKQVLDVPRLHTNLLADLTMPRVRGLHLLTGWSFTARKEATRNDAVSVPGYNLFNLGARYTPGGERGRVTFYVYASDITDKRYWSDTGANYGDTFIWLGAPTTVRLDAHYTF